jgi:hypothetical protein
MQTKKLELKSLNTKQITLQNLENKSLAITFVRRGVIGINKIGYI